MTSIRFTADAEENRVYPETDPETGQRHPKAGQTYKLFYKRGDVLNNCKQATVNRWLSRGKVEILPGSERVIGRPVGAQSVPTGHVTANKPAPAGDDEQGQTPPAPPAFPTFPGAA